MKFAALVGQAAKDADIELDSSRKKHPCQFNSSHEGYAVILEELDELWDEIKKQKPDKRKMRAEAVQIAAMAMRFMEEVCDD